MAPKKQKPSFCVNCGQAVTGKTAAVAGNPDIQFCCKCSVRLKNDGTCKNPACPFFKEKPIC